MPKHGFLSPKAISNRIKARGLQKLRWYCSMCQKQCRDENGFKCHCASEAHLRQMKLFSENPGRFMAKASREFTSGFMAVLRLRGRKRIFANEVYNEYIKDRHHVHMKATHWTSLSGFVQYLGKTGRAEIDKGERGWYIKYVEKDPFADAKEKAKEGREKMEMDEQERNEERVRLQMEAAHASKAELELQMEHEEEEHKELRRETQDTIKFSLVGKKAKVALPPIVETWMMKGLIVKFVDPEFREGLFYKKKAVVLDVQSKLATLLIVKSNDTLVSIGEGQVQPVLPPLQGQVRVIKGPHRGAMGTLYALEEQGTQAQVLVGSDTLAFPVAHLCKMAPIKT